MSAQKGFVPILMVLLIAVAALAGGFWIYQFNSSNPPNPSSTPKVACTQDAKLCPDGSSVGRVGPNCEFAPCPAQESTNSAETTNWKTYNHPTLNYTVKYPSNWTLKKDIRDKWYPGQHVDFIIQSPDYKEEMGLAFTTIVSGTQIIISAGKPYKSSANIDNFFNDEPLLKQIARNKTDLIVDDIPAIQYDSLYESLNVTTTIWLSGELLYSIVIKYPNDAEWRTTNWDIYQQILSTFKFLP